MKKLLTIKSHDSEVPMSVQSNIMSLIGHLWNIVTFAIIRCRCSIWRF